MGPSEMSLRFRLIFAAIALGQVFVVLGFVADREYDLRSGGEVVLQALPVDPRSLFQGDYAILTYEISRPPIGMEAEPGDTVFVRLQEGPEVWRAVAYESTRPGDGTFIRGELGGDGNIDFGLGTFFVPEGTGHVVEQAGDLKVIVSLDESGSSIIKDVLVDGIPFNEATKRAGATR